MKINFYSLCLVTGFWFAAMSFTMNSKIFQNFLIILDYSIIDLEYNSTAFGSEAVLWKYYNSAYLTATDYTICGSTPLLGGYMNKSSYGVERFYYGIPPHKSVFVSLKIWMIDWNPSFMINIFNVYFDGGSIISFGAANSSAVNVCGQVTQNDLAPVTLLYKATHAWYLFYISIFGWTQTSMFGFREISILFSNQTVNGSFYCGITQPQGLLQSSVNCPCPTKMYWNITTQQCESCHFSCENCFGSTSADCYSCGNKHGYDGTNCASCNSSLEHYYSNGTCLLNCSSPFYSLEDTLNKFCEFPCSPGLFLYLNNSCKAQCPSLFQKIQGVEAYCTFPCNSSQYYYWNASCLSTCPSPFSSREDALNKFCDFPCSPQTFLWPNGSCLSTCEFPMIIWNDSLSSQFCKEPCENNFFYYQISKVCKPSCPDPYQINLTTYYKSCKDTVETALIKEVTAITSVTGTATTVGLQVANTASSGSPGGLAIEVIMKMFSYVKYLDLGYSLELQEALKTWKSSFIPFKTAPDIPETLKEGNATLPSIFTKYDVFPRFLANFWQDLFFLFLLFGICLMLRLLEWLAPKVKKKYFPESLFCGLRILFQNSLLTLLYGSYGDIVLYSMLDFKSNDFATIMSILSFLISAAFLLFTVLFLLFHFWLLRKYQRMRSEAVKKRKFGKLENFIGSQKGVQVIFREFKDGSFSQQAFLLFFTLRDLLFSLVLAFLYPYPLIQTIIINILSVAMLIYLFITKPFKKKFDFVQQIFCELAILIINISVLITAIEDALGNEVDEIRIFLGKLAIYLNVGFGLLVTGFVIIGLVIKAVDFYKFYRIFQNRRKKRKRILERLSNLSSPNLRSLPPAKLSKKIRNPKSKILDGIKNPNRAKPSNKITDPESKIPAGTNKLNRLSKIAFINRPVVYKLDPNNSTNQIIETSFQNQRESSFSLIQPKNTLAAEQLKTTVKIKRIYSRKKKTHKAIDIRLIR